MAFFKCYDRARSIVVSTYPDRSNILSIPRFHLICLSPHTLLINEYPDLLNFSTSKHELNRCLMHPYGGETGDSILLEQLSFLFSSASLACDKNQRFGPIDIHAAAKKFWAPMKGATRRPPKHSIPHPLECKERLTYVTWLSSTASGPDKDDFNDGYIVATRILVYQLLHTPKPGPTNP